MANAACYTEIFCTCGFNIYGHAHSEFKNTCGGQVFKIHAECSPGNYMRLKAIPEVKFAARDQQISLTFRGEGAIVGAQPPHEPQAGSKSPPPRNPPPVRINKNSSRVFSNTLVRLFKEGACTYLTTLQSFSGRHDELIAKDGPKTFKQNARNDHGMMLYFR